MYLLISIISFLILYNCEATPVNSAATTVERIDGKLPFLGGKTDVDGKSQYHTVPPFKFVNQYGDTISQNTYANKAYVVDYFFTSCPTICPKVKEQELKIHDTFKETENLGILSVSIDTKYDNVERLKWYADKLEIGKGNWNLVTGEKDFIFDIADDFFHIAIEDPDAPGGFDHDGRLILIDKNKHIRSYCNGLDEAEVERFIGDIKSLLNEE